MSERWYIQGHEGERIGPYDAEQMQRHAQVGSLAPEDLVWTERIDTWIPASSVEGLFPVDQERPVVHPAAPSATVAPTKNQRLRDPAYDSTARALKLIHLGCLGGFLTIISLGFVSWIIPKLSPEATSVASYLSLTLAGLSYVFLLIKLVGHCMGFGTPVDATARGCFAGALACQLLPVVAALFGSSAFLLLSDDFLGEHFEQLSWGTIVGALSFLLIVSILQPITDLLTLMLMSVYLKRISLSLGLIPTDAIALLRRLLWLLGTLALAMICLTFVALGAHALFLLALGLFLASAFQYFGAFFAYLNLLSATRRSIILKQKISPQG